jgi:hypothetical protein
MITGRALAVAMAVLAVLWFALDSGISSQPPVPGTSTALAILAVVFAMGAFVMHAGGRPERVPLLIGLALGLGTYLLVRALTFA